MLLGISTLLIAIVISAVAAYYSVLGLTAIFAAAFWPIVIMGGALETGKIMTAVWLHRNWKRAGTAYKLYLVPALVFLMLLTSMGIFGFLSKAHLDQTVPTGDVAAQVALIDEKIKNERDTIANARALIKQLDDAVTGINASADREVKRRDGTTYTQSGAERALAVRRSQARDRAALTKTIDEAQATIVKLQEQKAPIAKDLRKIEAEVGPVKYVAALIYGDNPDTNTLEKAVRWVIILIVLVFDPLAVVLILAGSKQIEWARGINFEAEDHHREVMRRREIEQEENTTQERPNHDNVVDLDQINNLIDPVVNDDYSQVIEQAQQIQRLEKEYQDLKAKHGTIAQIESDLAHALEIIDILEENEKKNSQEKDRLLHDNKELEAKLDELVALLEEAIARGALLEQEIETLQKSLNEKEQVNESIELNETPQEEPTIQETPEQISPTSGPTESEVVKTEIVEPALPLDSHVVESISLVADNDDTGLGTSASFGTKFPNRANRGDLFLRVDYLPSKLFKWNGNKWIEVDKRLTDSYTYNDQYIKHLISRVSKGEYDIDDLSDNEKSQIDDFLKNNPNAQ